MSQRDTDTIEDYLQKEDVQERIRRNMERGLSELTVTISRAARLFGFSENQLRDWENRRLLAPQRSKDVKGQRQYTPDDLNKLAIIRELLDANYGPSDIPVDIDKIWETISQVDGRHEQIQASKILETRYEQSVIHRDIDANAYVAYKDLFWRYYASQALRLSLMLICENLPPIPAGLILPMKNSTGISVNRPEELAVVGESLVGWLGQTRSFYTLLTDAPTFEYPSDYRVFALQASGENSPKDGTWIIVDREAAKHLNLTDRVVETIRRLLAPLYEDVQHWQRYFGLGMKDLVNPAIDLDSGLIRSDIILTGLANMVIRLGCKTIDNRNRWRFCCIMLPEDSTIPLQQRSLVVRAQSKHSPHMVTATTISPGRYVNSLSLRAFQSGVIIYRNKISDADTTIALREIEGPIKSAVAIPAGSENGQPVAVLYVVSDEENAFSKADQRVLRMLGRMVEELLLTYRIRRQTTEKLDELIRKPKAADPLFGDFLSENEFILDVEAVLTEIKTRMDERPKYTYRYDEPVIDHDVQPDAEQPPIKEIISFMSLDIDHQSRLANLYGEMMTRNLSRTIGLRVQEMIKTLITKHTDCKLYHIYANRYYMLLKGIPLEEARIKAEAIRQSLEGSISIEQLKPPSRPIALPGITVRLGVASYTYPKLEENLVSTNTADIVAEVRAKIIRALDVTLNMGMDEGGNVVFAWDRDIGGFVRWSPIGNT